MTSILSKIVTGDGRIVKVADLAELYRDNVNRSLPTNGKIQRIGEHVYSITNNFSTVDCDTLESINTFKVYALSTKKTSETERCIDSVRCISDQHEVAEIVSATSENGRFLARLKSPKDSSNPDAKKQLLEIWDRSKLLKTIDTSDLDAHGSIINDPQFSNFVWSPFGEQDKLLYVCQHKRPKFMSFFKEPPTKNDQISTSEEELAKAKGSPTDLANASRGEEFIKREDWGEGLVGIEHTIVAVLDIANNCQINTIDIEGNSLGNPQWLDNGTKVVSVAYKENPRRLGIIYCNNRPSKIVVHDWQSSSKDPLLELASDTECFHTPRVNHAGDKFIYLANPVYGAHQHSVKLFIHDLRTRTIGNLVDSSTNNSEFFIHNLPRSCFTSDDKNILLSIRNHLYGHMCLFSIEKSKFLKVKFPTTGTHILDFRYDIILASGSEINATPTLFVAALNLQSTDVVAWHQIEDCIHLDEVEYETYEIPTSDKSSFVSAILIRPILKVLQENYFSGSQKAVDIAHHSQLPTVIRVHGGPHNAFACEYYQFAAFYARLGLQTILINYRGSTGVSEDYVQSLCGKIGQLDVDDCLHVIRYFVHELKVLDPAKLVIQGGSHGGFLSCHLSCQEEFKFTSAVIINPVVDLSTSHTTTDIPDWCYTESLGHKHFDHTWVPTSQELVRMFECSPMSKHNKANVPTLMLLGKNDQRVKMFQGERWVDLLRARGIETMCKVYPDKHDLGKVEVSSDATMTAVIWILSHLPK